MNTLLAVDGSDNSYEAVHALKCVARAEQLTLLHALDVPRPGLSNDGGGSGGGAL